ncbi:MAG: NAD(+) synthase [Candidatus Omnitrophota bacterium]
MKLSEKIAKWIKEQVEISGKSGIVFGMSGGIDSAVVGALSKIALRENVLALILPCESTPEDVELASLAAKKFGIKTKTIDLGKIYADFESIYPGASKLAKANLKPRLRMVTEYYYANALNYLVAGTGNKSELAIGYFTKYGDGGVDILPIGDLLKLEVRQLASELGVPKTIIDRPPTAGLWQGQTDEGEMGITYEKLDEAIHALEKGKLENIDSGILRKVKKMAANAEHKKAKIPKFMKNEN